MLADGPELLGRIRGLLAMAESSRYPAEAAAFAAKRGYDTVLNYEKELNKAQALGELTAEQAKIVDADARNLVKVRSGVKAKVNLLPLNEAAGIPFERPSDDRVNAFASILAGKGLMVSVRKSRGRDIRAACGQLIVDGGRKASAGQALAAVLG